MNANQAKKHVFLSDYSSLSLRSGTYDIMKNFEAKNVVIDHNMAIDSHLMNVKHWPSLVFNPNSKTSWESVLRGYYESEEYKRMNEKVHANPILAKMATTNFLDGILKGIENSQQQMPNNQQGNQGNNPQGNNQNGNNQGNQGQNSMQGFFQQLNQMPQQQCQNVINGIVATLGSQAAKTEEMADAMAGFSHMGVPLERYDFDQVRELLANKIAINMMKIFRKMVSLPMGKNLTAPSPRRGIPIGTKVMRSFSEIVDLQPSEYLDDDLMSYKIATRTAQVKQRYSGIKNVVVYLDKSGSMGGSMPYEGEYIERVAFAGGCAFALAKQLKAMGGSLKLKLFDTEVHKEITDNFEILKAATSIRADGGTNITGVLEDALQYSDEQVMLVSDGIDSVDEAAARKASQIDMRCILIQENNEILEKYLKVQHVDKLEGNFLVEV
jgi:hypothetical protein